MFKNLNENEIPFYFRLITLRTAFFLKRLITGTWPDPVWTAWSDCSVTCGFGVQRRTRSCELPIALRIKYKCFTRETETKNCSKVQCIGTLDFILPSVEFICSIFFYLTTV